MIGFWDFAAVVVFMLIVFGWVDDWVDRVLDAYENCHRRDQPR